jgi:hypothetical protein
LINGNLRYSNSPFLLSAAEHLLGRSIVHGYTDVAGADWMLLCIADRPKFDYCFL